jgi:hypothetical protein
MIVHKFDMWALDGYEHVYMWAFSNDHERARNDKEVIVLIECSPKQRWFVVKMAHNMYGY